MKTRLKVLCLLSIVFSIFTPTFAALDIPSDGSDGELIITVSTNIDLSGAVTGVWSNDNSAFAGRGIYDSNKWAIVFKYSNIVIAEGATVTFSNHPSRAPVVWLVHGDVTIDGTLQLNGKNISTAVGPEVEPGPGGFRGGAMGETSLGQSGGYGPGGAYNDYGHYGHNQSRSYGNPQIVPLIGGSGGAGELAKGSGGGGAILIAASQSISISGSGLVQANGGRGGFNDGYRGWHGSGGAVRLVADQILGVGRLEAVAAFGYPGRIRIEGNSVSPALTVNPPTVAVPPVPLTIWPDENSPTVRVVAVDGQSAPLDPRANMAAGGNDLTISTMGTNTIVLQTSNFPTNGIVNVYIKPRNAAQSIRQAALVGGDGNLATWQVKTALPVSHTIIQARAVAQ